MFKLSASREDTLIMKSGVKAYYCVTVKACMTTTWKLVGLQWRGFVKIFLVSRSVANVSLAQIHCSF